MVDIWAMGVLLFFMLVGNTPFRGDTISDLRQNILKGFFDLPDYLSSFAQLIITRMLEMNPEKRMTVFDIKVNVVLKSCITFLIIISTILALLVCRKIQFLTIQFIIEH